MLKSLIKPVVVIAVFLLGFSGSVWVKGYLSLSEASFMCLVTISAIISILLPQLDNLKSLSLAKGEIIMQEVKDSENAVKELAVAVSGLLDESIEHALLDGRFDQERYNSAKAKLNALTTKK